MINETRIHAVTLYVLFLGQRTDHDDPIYEMPMCTSIPSGKNTGNDVNTIVKIILLVV